MANKVVTIFLKYGQLCDLNILRLNFRGVGESSGVRDNGIQEQLGILTIMDDRLKLALGVHAATNFAGAVFVGYDGGAITTDSMFVSHALNPLHMVIGFYIIATIFLLATSKKYKWSSFKKLIDPIYKPDDDTKLQELLIKSNTV